MRVFLAGIMQGSIVHNDVHAQSYREFLTDLLRTNVDAVDVFDPWAVYPNSHEYEEALVRDVLLANIAEAARSDLVVAYLPQASMGTALEMWEAYHQGRPVITISPLVHNWVIKGLSTRVLADLAEFRTFVESGEFERVLRATNNA